MKILTAGEDALLLYWGEQQSPEIAARVQYCYRRLLRELGDSVVELVPSYASLLVKFEPELQSPFQLRRRIRHLLATKSSVEGLTGKRLELPVYYSEESGPDLERIARAHGLSVERVIQLHQQQEYLVYAIGFIPGFAYLGDVPETIATPRHGTPRRSVPRGSVAIADRQTAVYPAESPGGWNLIGLCPVTLFDPERLDATPFTVGDKVTFKAIDRPTFLSLGGVL